MDRRRFLLALLAGVFHEPGRAQAQPRGKVYRIGYIGVAPIAPGVRSSTEKVLVATLRDLGYVEGNNL